MLTAKYIARSMICINNDINRISTVDTLGQEYRNGKVLVSASALVVELDYLFVDLSNL